MTSTSSSVSPSASEISPNATVPAARCARLFPDFGVKRLPAISMAFAPEMRITEIAPPAGVAGAQMVSS